MRIILAALPALLVALPASARGPVVLQDEVRCVIVRRGNTSWTRCTVVPHQADRQRGWIPDATPRVGPNSAAQRREDRNSPLPIPDLSAPEIPDADPGLPDADPEIPPEPPLDPRTADADPEIPPPLRGDELPAPALPENPPDTDLPELDGDQAPSPPARPRPQARPPAAPPRSTANLVEEEAQVVELLNQERANRGLGPLTIDPVAVAVARAHSQDMCQRHFFDHVSPEGKQPWDRLRAAGARFTGAGENIAVGYTTAQAVHQGWLASPGHRANRLKPTYTRTGVGLYHCGNVPFWTEVFMK